MKNFLLKQLLIILLQAIIDFLLNLLQDLKTGKITPDDLKRGNINRDTAYTDVITDDELKNV